MEKKRFSLISGIYVCWKSKFFKKMRITLILLLIVISQVFALGTYSQNARLNLNYSNVTIAKVLDAIENQSEFFFMYEASKVDVNQIVTIVATNQTVPKILDQLFQNSDITYKIDNRQIALSTESIALQSQQQRSISGRVTDTTGAGLPGVSVVIKGTTNGVITDMDGNYTLPKVPVNAILQFSFVGMKSQEVKVGTQSSINILLIEESIGIDEVVAIGYGKEKRVNVIGSVSQISASKIENRSLPQLTNALSGQMSGVTVIQNSGKPGGSNSSIRVRGEGSFGATPEALVIIDGIPGKLDDVNMNDVESVSVLKDASSAAIYGARAANGVILVTTKRGTNDKIKVNYSGYVGITKPTELPDLASSAEYAEMINIASGTNSYSADDIAKFKSGVDPDKYPNTNWMNEVFDRNGVQTEHNLSIAGGVKSNNYFLSFGYLDQSGIVQKNGYNRYNFLLNNQSELSKTLKLTNNISASNQTTYEPTTPANDTHPGVESIIGNSVRLPAIFVSRYTNGQFGPGLENSGTPVSWIASDSYVRKPSFSGKINSKLE